MADDLSSIDISRGEFLELAEDRQIIEVSQWLSEPRKAEASQGKAFVGRQINRFAFTLAFGKLPRTQSRMMVAPICDPASAASDLI